MTDDLVTRSKTLSAMINLGERIAWGQDTAMIDELSDRIEADAATIARLREEAFEWRDKALENFNRATKASQDAEAAEAKVAALVEAAQGMSTPIKNVDFETRLEQHGRLFAAIAAAKEGA